MSCEQINFNENATAKYNWSNADVRFSRGYENSQGISFGQVVPVDYVYNYRLFGPFSTSGGVQRIRPGGNGQLTKSAGECSFPSTNFASSRHPGIGEEGSNDYRDTTSKSYSDWDKNYQKYDEKPIPLTHVIYNPNVTKVNLTLKIDRLADMVEKSLGDVEDPELEAGARIPSVLNIRVETGLIQSNGVELVTYATNFQISALVENGVSIDLGNPRSDNGQGILECDIKNVLGGIGLERDRGDVYEYYELEPAFNRNRGIPQERYNTSSMYSSTSNRFIRITKNSHESNSTLIDKEVSVEKISEVQDFQLNYPYTAAVSTVVDARVFSSIPIRTFDCKLKQVRIPSNYNPTLPNGYDKRRYKQACQLGQIDKNIYDGDWDGNLKWGWTDNPAWILYDMLTDFRYGLGNHIEPETVNKWDLYNIARYCDAVDDNGDFVGVQNSDGGLEPRFSCNIMFSAETKIYDALNTITAIFRGSIYYSKDSVEFTDDRPKDPVALFNNQNVKNGVFSYSTYKREEQFNSVEVIYIDQNEDFKTKTELVEDLQDIRKRGVFKKTLDVIGVTSKAQARRAAWHVIYQTTKENQILSFECGNEILLCRPGDFIHVEDELKTGSINYGRVLEVNQDNYWIKINNPFSSSYEKKIKVYIPVEESPFNTGYLGSSAQIKELEIESYKNDDFGCTLFIKNDSINSNLIEFVPKGSAYRSRLNNRNSDIYKILSIRDSEDGYEVSAHKYLKNKYEEIEAREAGVEVPSAVAVAGDELKPYYTSNLPPYVFTYFDKEFVDAYADFTRGENSPIVYSWQSTTYGKNQNGKYSWSTSYGREGIYYGLGGGGSYKYTTDRWDFQLSFRETPSYVLYPGDIRLIDKDGNTRFINGKSTLERGGRNFPATWWIEGFCTFDNSSNPDRPKNPPKKMGWILEDVAYGWGFDQNNPMGNPRAGTIVGCEPVCPDPLCGFKQDPDTGIYDTANPGGVGFAANGEFVPGQFRIVRSQNPGLLVDDDGEIFELRSVWNEPPDEPRIGVARYEGEFQVEDTFRQPPPSSWCNKNNSWWGWYYKDNI